MCESRLWLSAVARKPEQVGSGCWIFSSAVRWRCTKWPVAIPCCAGWQTQLRTELCRLDKKCRASGNQEFRHQRISILTVESGPASLLPLANNVEYINCMQACVCPSMTPKNAPSHWGSGTTPNTYFLEPSLVHTQNQGCSAAGTRLNSVPANILEPQRRSANIVGHRWNANTEVFRQITSYSLGWPSMSLFSVPNCPQMRIWHQKSQKKIPGVIPPTPSSGGDTIPPCAGRKLPRCWDLGLGNRSPKSKFTTTPLLAGYSESVFCAQPKYYLKQSSVYFKSIIVGWNACFRTFHFPTVEYALNETEVVAYKCCDGWRQPQNETGCTQSEFNSPPAFMNIDTTTTATTTTTTTVLSTSFFKAHGNALNE